MTITLTLPQLLGACFAMFCVAYTVTDITKTILCAAKTAAALDEPEAQDQPAPPKWNTETDYHLLTPPLPPAISLDFSGFGLGWEGEPTGTFRTLDVDPPEVLVGEVEPPSRARFERKPDRPLVKHVLTIDLHDERYDRIEVPLAVGS